MTTKTRQEETPEQRKSVIQWLLDSDPSIRWQVMRDLMDESDEIVAGERSRVASEGWGARLLDLQASDGQWGGGTWLPRCWISTSDTLLLLKDLGLDPTSERARSAVGLVRASCTWGPEFGDSPFFEGEVEPLYFNGQSPSCIRCLFRRGERSATLDRLLHEQLEDGGWITATPRPEQAIVVSPALDDLCS